MYVAQHFGYSAEQLGAMLSRVRVADLVTVGPDGPEATLVPWTFHPDEGEHGVLHAHLSRVNRQWHQVGPALVVLHGPDSYVDPSDVPEPAAVPTWDYITMHVRGRMIAHDDPEWVQMAMAEMVAAQHSGFDFRELPTRMLDGLVRSAVGVEIVIESVTGKAKMSQNQSSGNILGIADALADRAADPAKNFQGTAPDEVVEFLRTESLAHARAREALVDDAREAHEAGAE
ncbi:FMN-binding negative transcriptional regulator [Propionibacterium sp.]|uniref:FMN-binding negative transcriptional regulator n=1 Tax=Propionibacterium sp. TaxID=1977903 RepID=UPI0039E82480